MRLLLFAFLVVSASLTFLFYEAFDSSVAAHHTTNPTSVTLAGSLQSELGCSGDWLPECSATHLTYDANDDVWQRNFSVPAGNWEYKAPVNNSWSENYGRYAQQNGPNVPLDLSSGAASVKFYYDHKSHWITSARNAVIAVAPGSFQSELGCSSDWDPSCLRSWLQDPDENGIYTFSTSALPAGNYETKVAINESWDENYGEGGVLNGPNIAFTVPATGTLMTFSYNAVSHVLTVTAAGPPPSGDVQWSGLRHDTFDDYYRSPFGAVPAGSSVNLRFRTLPFDVTDVAVRVYTFNTATGSTSGPTDIPMAYLEDRVEDGTNYAIWSVSLPTPSTPSVLYYKFKVTDQSDEDFYSDTYTDDHDNLNQGGEGAATDGEPFPAFQITAYAPNFTTPLWLQNANVYQIFPDRFRNGDPSNDYCRPGSTAGCPTFYGDQTPLLREPWNTQIGDPRQPGPFQNQYGTQFYGGDLKGIEDKLDYLQSLSIDTIYLNPIFTARSNHRYDADDFLQVDPALGGDAAFASLRAAADARGIRLIFDGVFNHSSSDSVYFDRYNRYAGANGACESAGSQYRDWYNFFNANAPCSGADYEGWFGFDSLAVFRDDSAEVRNFFYKDPNGNVTKFWYDRGAAGWRFDVANELSHNWWTEYRPAAKQYKGDGPLIGEIWPDASQYLAGDQLDSVMNYRFRKNVLGFARGVNWSDNDNSGGNVIVGLSPSQFDRALRSVREDYPEAATRAMLNLIDSHDTNRALYTLTLSGDNGSTEAKERLKLSALFQFTYLGAPMVYYGDEAAINAPSTAGGPNGPEDDPYNRAPYPWSDVSGDQSIYGPADQNVIDHYRRLGKMRKKFAVLRSGDFRTLHTGDTTAAATDNNVYAFARTAGDQKAVVVLNNGGTQNTADINVSSVFSDGAGLVDVLTNTEYTVNGGTVSVVLPSRSGVVLLPAGSFVDITPPTIGDPAANPSVLFRPNHKMRDVTLSYSVSDDYGTPACSLSVTSNEPVNGDDDGNTAPDWEIVSSTLVRLRAERSGTGGGRVYTVTVSCTDSDGNSSSKFVNVFVR